MIRKIPFLICFFYLFISPCFIHANQSQIVIKTILDFKDELSLNEDQVQKIKGIIEGFEKEARSLRQKISSLDKEIMQLLDKEGDVKEIGRKIKEVYSLRAELIISEIEAGRKINSVLTPEQLKKWKEIKNVIRKIRR